MTSDSTIDLAQIRALAREVERALSRALDRAIGQADTLDVDLAFGLHSNIFVVDAAIGEPEPSRVSGRLMDHAVRVLPPVHRRRYREEWRAELADITGRRHRLAYAIRLLALSPSLRRALRGLVPTPEQV